MRQGRCLAFRIEIVLIVALSASQVGSVDLIEIFAYAIDQIRMRDRILTRLIGVTVVAAQRLIDIFI